MRPRMVDRREKKRRGTKLSEIFRQNERGKRKGGGKTMSDWMLMVCVARGEGREVARGECSASCRAIRALSL
jgi:hypothetical protein